MADDELAKLPRVGVIGCGWGVRVQVMRLFSVVGVGQWSFSVDFMLVFG